MNLIKRKSVAQRSFLLNDTPLLSFRWQFFFLLLILASCKVEDKPVVQGCMDPNSLTYNKNATLSDPQACDYAGGISVIRDSIANAGDILEFWWDSAHGKGLHLLVEEIYNRLPTVAYPCFDGHSPSFEIPLGRQVYQLKKHLANGQVIVLTQPDTVNVYNRFCKTVEVK